MKWIKSEVAPKVCSLLVDEHGVIVGAVEYDKRVPLELRELRAQLKTETR